MEQNDVDPLTEWICTSSNCLHSSLPAVLVEGCYPFQVLLLYLGSSCVVIYLSKHLVSVLMFFVSCNLNSSWTKCFQYPIHFQYFVFDQKYPFLKKLPCWSPAVNFNYWHRRHVVKSLFSSAWLPIILHMWSILKCLTTLSTQCSWQMWVSI